LLAADSTALAVISSMSNSRAIRSIALEVKTN
jgi:hypothetical protein